LDQVAPTGSK
jgi:hypothetical protein